jgi:hypothetical protein
VDYHKADAREVATHSASREEAAQFLRELRQLRSGAGLGHAELAARAHYPHDSIRAAEVGPALPELPVLAAYVRGCGGTSEEWEERWRRVTRSPALPTLPTRAAGCSDAATAGARIGAVTTVSDGPDPGVILAALDRVAEEMAEAEPAYEAAVMAASSTAPPARNVFTSAAVQPRAATAEKLEASGTASPPWSPAAAVPASQVLTTSATETALAAGQTSVAGVASADGVASAVGKAQPATAPSTGGRLPLPPRALVAALVAVAVCVIAAVLAIFA